MSTPDAGNGDPQKSPRESEFEAGQRQCERRNTQIFGNGTTNVTATVTPSAKKPEDPWNKSGVGRARTGGGGTGLAVTTKQPHAEDIKPLAKHSPAAKGVPDTAKASGGTGPAKNVADFLRRVLPWPKDGEPGFINLHWLIPAPRDPNKLIWIGKPTRTIEEFLSLLEWVLSRPTTRDVYFCLSLQAHTKKNGSGNLTAVRNKENALLLKAIWLDIDVKPPPKGYATPEEALDALAEFVKANGLPPPSALVGSGGGLHVYWFSDKPLTPDEWRPYANGLKAAAINFGLRCDTQCTVNAAQVLRVPCTFNYKTDPPRPVKLLGICDND